MPLGRLEKRPFREGWADESAFSDWLADDGLSLLGETLKMEFSDAQREVGVGNFSADLVCTDANDESKAVVENQLGVTDHSHLGQLLTYAAGQDAVTLVWIAAKFREEHRATLDMLNQESNSMRIFGLEIELWRIGDSHLAPKFNIVSQPNDSLHTARQVAGGQLTTHQTNLINFWNRFREHLIETSANTNPPAARGLPWLRFGIGRGGAWIAPRVGTSNEEFGQAIVRIYFDGDTAPAFYGLLERQREDIENQLGYALEWHAPENGKRYTISHSWEANWENEEEWTAIHTRMGEVFGEMVEVFRPRIQALNPDDWDGDE